MSRSPSASGTTDPAARRAGLSSAKRELLKQWARRKESVSAGPRSIPRRDSGEPAPLSFAQQRIWFIDQLEPGSPAYNISAAFELRGDLDRRALTASFDEIVWRHEVLRTTFEVVDDSPVQVVHAGGRIAPPVIDLRGLPESRRERVLRTLGRAEGRRAFDLSRGPLLRLHLLHLAPLRHVLLLTVSHSAADGWSIGRLIQELAGFYRERRGGRPAAVPELPVQYSDFAVWQRRYLSGDRLANELAYWREELAGVPSLLELPADRPRPPVQSFRGAQVPFEVSAPRLAGLRAACRESSATLFMGLLAGFATLLHRYSGQPDVVVGSPVANRRHRELEGLIGFFANTLVLRTRLGDDPAFGELLRQVQATCRGAFAHQDLPFERLVEALQPERHLSHTPLFQVMLVLQNAPMPPLDLPGIELTLAGHDQGTAKFDLLLNVTESDDGGVSGALEYNTDLFDRDRMRRLLDHFGNLLEAAGGMPARPVSRLPLLGEAERRQVLTEWNDTTAPAPRFDGVHQGVELAIARWPDAIAAVWAGQDDGAGTVAEVGRSPMVLSYGELGRRARGLASELRALGVEPDSRVAICLERSLDLVIAALAVLQAGGAYVPVDPDYPAERIAYMVRDSRARVVITRRTLAGLLPADGGRPWFLDDREPSELAAGDPLPGHPTSPDQLAYLIYTSGSTGRPKGVAMPHAALTNLFAWQVATSGAGRGSRTLQFASLGFDVSCQEIFTTWWSGGTLVLVSAEVRRDPTALCEVLREERVERLFLPFIALQQIAEAVAHGVEPPSALSEIHTAGEQLQITRPIEAWLGEGSGILLTNQYGPSEGHVVTEHALSGPVSGWPHLPPIGRPVTNNRIHLLDRHLEPVPIGVPGQVYIAGRQVVRGYLRRPALTAERFVPDPWSGRPGARLYATGDLARWLPAGRLQHMGRIDHQVKIRGFRVEPGEVETLMVQHRAVQEAAVVVQGEGGDRRLVGYFVSRERIAPSTLREELRSELPEYMVPTTLVRLDALPLTPTGKVQRSALPEPGAPDAESGGTAPRNELEEIVARIWMEILDVSTVDVHTDFFALGGHSLTATRLVYALRRALDVDLPLRALFADPTVAGLAAAIATLRAGPTATSLPVMTHAELAAEAVLDPAVAEAAGRAGAGAVTPVGDRSQVLLTGATGFLGAFLLAELLRQLPQARVHCLVRAPDAPAAMTRIRDRLRSFALWEDGWTERIVPLPGDLAKPGLGLARSELQRLGRELDAIYHNGAWVNLFYAYSTLEPANVQGTREILRLATLGRLKPVHYVSTSGVFFSAGSPAPDRVDETTDLDAVPGLIGGYAQSKWVAEKLVHLAGARGVPVTVYRPGRIGGHSRTGLGNPDDLLFRILEGSLQLGAAPELELDVELSPVDYVGAALVHLSRQDESIGRTFHLLNPSLVPWRQLLAWLREMGVQLAVRPWGKWLEALHEAAERDTGNVLYPLLPVLSAEPSAAAGESSEAQAREPRFDCRRTQAALAGSGLSCPRLDPTLLHLYLEQMGRVPATARDPLEKGDIP
ncbi:MAG: amino acid adenylation domain-containing protein [Acidobacteriota bacterium]|jgi:amino acid adenylation domain-containing protein/thioester reductase-like protein